MRDIVLSMFAQPPSPETKTTSVSELPRVAGTSIRGRFVAVAMAKRRESIGRGEEQHRPGIYLATTPRNPPEISVARFVRIRGSHSPPGEARYIGSQTGSNFSLYWRRPWKL